MRHTVIGVFDTYDQAEVARSALIASGFARRDIELQAAPDAPDAPSSPADPAMTGAPGNSVAGETGVLANIERFFSMLFGSREQPPEVAHYSEAVRRGAVLVAVDTADEAHADLARTTLAEQGAIDIDERAASWGTLSHAFTSDTATAEDREHSILDELGLGAGRGVPGCGPVNPAVDPLDAARAESIRARAYPRADVGDPAVDSLDPISPVARDPFAGSSDSSYRATGGDPMTSGSTWAEGRMSDGPPADPLSASEALGASAQGWRPVEPPDALDETVAAARRERDATSGDYHEYDDDFRSDYASNYAATGSSYEEYEGAYRYGASVGSDERYRSRNWDDDMESELRSDWASRHPQGADTWERFKSAVRHGWDRVTGHHHM
jgi:hypothetical protein